MAAFHCLHFIEFFFIIAFVRFKYALAFLRSSWLHPPPFPLTPVGLCVFTGVDGGAVRVMGAKGVAPSCDYKVKGWTEPFVSLEQQHRLTFVLRPGVCHLPGWVQGHSRLPGRRTTCGSKGPSHRPQHHQTVRLQEQGCSRLLLSEIFSVCRMRRIFQQMELQDFSSVNAQVLGAEDLYGAHACTKVTPW